MSTTAINQTAKKLLRKAQSLLQEHGYQFLSFQDLADQMKIRKASVHHYFRTKEDLARAMILDYQKNLERIFQDIAAKGTDPRQKLRLYFQLIQEISRSGKMTCPGSACLLDWNNFSKEIRQEVQKFTSQHRNWLIEIFNEAIEKKVFLPSKDQVLNHANLVGAALHGGMLLARSSPNPEIFFKNLFSQIEAVSFKKERESA